MDELTRSIQVSPQDKIIYAIGNYNDEDKVYSMIPDGSKLLSELETMTISNKNGFKDTNLLMVGKQVVQINGLVTDATIPMERLVARLDVYMFKSRRLENNTGYFKVHRTGQPNNQYTGRISEYDHGIAGRNSK